jgi:hypothetical protein
MNRNFLNTNMATAYAPANCQNAMNPADMSTCNERGAPSMNQASNPAAKNGN